MATRSFRRGNNRASIQRISSIENCIPVCFSSLLSSGRNGSWTGRGRVANGAAAGGRKRLGELGSTSRTVQWISRGSRDNRDHDITLRSETTIRWLRRWPKNDLSPRSGRRRFNTEPLCRCPPAPPRKLCIEWHGSVASSAADCLPRSRSGSENARRTSDARGAPYTITETRKYIDTERTRV